MPTKNTFIFFILGILFLASCTKEPDLTCTNTTFPGEWILTKIEGVSGTTYFPEDGGYIKKIEIGDNTWREFINDSLIIESIYTIHRDSTGSIFYHGQLTFNNQNAKSFSFTGCLLIFSGGWNDSPEIYYERK